MLCSRSPLSSLSILPNREIMQSLAASCRVGRELGEERAPTANPITELARTVSREMAPRVIQEL